MPKISNKIKLGILFFIFAGVFLIFQNSFSYDDKTTHPGITDEIVDFYNLSFSDKLTEEEKEWIVQGAIDEDAPPRWINHFYDPIYKTGWSGEKTGIWPTLLIQYFSSGVLSSENPANSLDWLHNQELQSKYGAYKGNRTWERAIYEAVKTGNKKEAYYTLGFILHLIEDASVPDHTRNDTHAHELSWATLDYGSPYEEFAKQFTRQNLQIAQELKNENSRPIVRNSIDEYLIFLAEYSNKYFFSKDTINDPKYQYPKIIKTDKNFGYGLDENRIEFPLANVVIVRIFENGEYKKIYNYYLPKKDSNSTVLKNYFSRLSHQAVLNGAGIINLFEQEVAKAEKEKLQNLPKESSAIWSLTGRFYQIKNFISAGVNLLSSPIKNFKENLSANVLSTLVNSDAKIQNNNQELAAMSISAFQGAGQQSSNSTSAAESSIVLPSEKPQDQPALIPSPSPQIKPVGEIAELSSADEVAGNVVPSPIETVSLPEQKQTEIAPEPAVPASPLNQTPSTVPSTSIPALSSSTGSSGASYSSPAPPTPNQPPLAPTTTLNNGLDFLTPTSTQVLAGVKPETASVLVNNSSDKVVSLSVTTWSKEVTLQEGLNTFTVKAKNDAGESPEITINITLDTTPPAVPQITSHSDNQILNTSTILLTGTAEASSTILITQNGAELEQVSADENGSWQKNVTLASGTNNFQIKAKDAVGNESSPLNFTSRFLRPPSQITDLSVAATTANSITLQWAAPSDQDTASSELAYDLRYSTQNIADDAAWQAATQASGEPAAANSGQSQTFTLPGLASGQTYYFVIKTYDNENNYSAISNTANATTPQTLIYEQNFESLNDGNLAGQDEWVLTWAYLGQWQVLTPYPNETDAYDGSKAIKAGVATDVARAIPATSKALISFAINVHNPGTLYFSLKSDDTILGQIDVTNYYAGLRVLNNDIFERVFDIVNDTWYLVKIETDSPNGRYRIKLGEGQWTDWKAFINNNQNQVNKIDFSYIKPNWFSDYVYFDAISISQVSD